MNREQYFYHLKEQTKASSALVKQAMVVCDSETQALKYIKLQGKQAADRYTIRNNICR